MFPPNEAETRWLRAFDEGTTDNGRETAHPRNGIYSYHLYGIFHARAIVSELSSAIVLGCRGLYIFLFLFFPLCLSGPPQYQVLIRCLAIFGRFATHSFPSLSSLADVQNRDISDPLSLVDDLASYAVFGYSWHCLFGFLGVKSMEFRLRCAILDCCWKRSRD